MDADHDNSGVSFGKELAGEEYDGSPVRMRRVVDRETMQLELAREMCQSKLNELLNAGSRLSAPQQQYRRSPSKRTQSSDDEYYQLMKRCLQAEVMDSHIQAKCERQARQLQQLKRKYSSQVQLLQQQVQWLRSSQNENFSSKRRRTLKDPQLQIDTEFEE